MAELHNETQSQKPKQAKQTYKQTKKHNAKQKDPHSPPGQFNPKKLYSMPYG